MVAAEQQAVFQQHQAQLVGGVAWREDHLETVGQIVIWPPWNKRKQLLIQERPVWREL